MEIIKRISGNNDWSKTFKKVLVVGALGAISSVISYLEVIPISPEEAIIVTTLLAILKGIEDFLKHRKK